MSGIDRRTLLGAAGAGLVLAGCTSNAKKKHGMDMVGTCALHGQSVTDKGPEVEGDVTSFAPNGICIVYLQFAANLVRVRRTYIDITGISPTNPVVQTRILGELMRISKLGAPVLANERDDIHPVKLGGQRIVVIYVNNTQDYIRFAHKRGSTVTPEEEKASYTHTVRFTQFSGENPDSLSSMIRKNHAFFNIRKVPLTGITTDMLSDTALFLEYWDTDEYGDKIIANKDVPDTHYIYSMNIKLEMAVPSTGTQRWVPVIVDPDTGNMGAEP